MCVGRVIVVVLFSLAHNIFTVKNVVFLFSICSIRLLKRNEIGMTDLIETSSVNFFLMKGGILNTWHTKKNVVLIQWFPGTWIIYQL